MARTIVVGDVHGCLDEFRSLLDLLSFRQGHDRLVQVGDLMDKGPDPVGCVRFARSVGAEVIMGNHEDSHVRFRRHEATRTATGKPNPMLKFAEDVDKVTQNAALSDDEVVWMASLPLVLDLGGGLVAVHGGFEPAFSVENQSKAMLRVRYVNDQGRMATNGTSPLDQPSGSVRWAERWTGPQSVVYGHAAHSLVSPKVDAFPGGWCFAVDTGAVYGGRLTAMVWIPGQDPEFVQVQSRQAHAEWYPGVE